MPHQWPSMVSKTSLMISTACLRVFTSNLQDLQHLRTPPRRSTHPCIPRFSTPPRFSIPSSSSKLRILKCTTQNVSMSLTSFLNSIVATTLLPKAWVGNPWRLGMGTRGGKGWEPWWQVRLPPP